MPSLFTRAYTARSCRRCVNVLNNFRTPQWCIRVEKNSSGNGTVRQEVWRICLDAFSSTVSVNCREHIREYLSGRLGHSTICYSANYISPSSGGALFSSDLRTAVVAAPDNWSWWVRATSNATLLGRGHLCRRAMPAWPLKYESVVCLKLCFWMVKEVTKLFWLPRRP